MNVYHLALDSASIEGARLAFLPGDPGRVPELARALDANARELAYRREYRTHLATVSGQPVVVTSTGIGGPSTSIAIDELAQLGLRTFVRVGTTGAIRPHIAVGDVIITTGAVRSDGASVDYAPIEYPAVADYEVVHALVESARERGTPFHVGVTVSAATFYPGEERADAYHPYVLRRLRGATDEWKNLHALSYEMEAATVLTLCSAMGLRGGSVTGVVNRAGGPITPEALRQGEQAVIEVAAAAAPRLLLLAG
jgi:uridine phosphorylase